MKFAICNETYRGVGFEDVCVDVATCGFDAIEVALNAIAQDPGTLTVEDGRRLGAVARANGLEVVGLHWLLAAPGGLHLTTNDDATRSRTVRYLQHLAELCAAMGGSILVLGSPNQRGVLPGQSYDEAFAHATEACHTVAETAGDLGLTLALEPLSPELTNFLTSAAEARSLIEAVDHPACRLHLDVYAMGSEPDPIPEIITAHGDLLVHFHANAPDRRGPGSGGLDYRPIVQALRDVDYQGYVSVEVFDYQPDGETIARESLAYLRRMFA